MRLPGATRASSFLVFASLALAACEASAPDADASTASSVAETEASPVAGTYETTLSDGTVIVQIIAADGTYRETNADGAMIQTGSWRQDGAEMCFDPEGDAPESCYAGNAADADGVFEIVDANGEVSTRVRRVSQAQAPAE